MAQDLKLAPVAFALVCAAGLSTCLGAVVVFQPKLVKLASKKVLATGLGLSAGVMLYISFIEIFFKSVGAFTEYHNPSEDPEYDERYDYAYATLCFFAGVFLMKAIDALTHYLHGLEEKRRNESAEKCPELEDGCCSGTKDAVCVGAPVIEHPPLSATLPCCHNGAMPDDVMEAVANEGDLVLSEEEKESRKKLVRMGLNTALAIAIHNFPEGVVTFVETARSIENGVVLFIAVAIHNIPEGLSVAIPVYYATGNRRKAFLWSLLSGISEPIAGAIMWIILACLPDGLSMSLAFAIIFGFISGMMVTIVVHELLPTAHRYDPADKVVTNAFVGGMMLMSLSLVMFKVFNGK